MSIQEGSGQLTVEHLLDGVQQLSPAELWEFTERFAEWQKQREVAEEDPPVRIYPRKFAVTRKRAKKVSTIVAQV